MAHARLVPASAVPEITFPAGRKFGAAFVKSFPAGRKLPQNSLDNIAGLVLAYSSEDSILENSGVCHYIYENTNSYTDVKERHEI
jgi:hypothetical protein